MRSGMARVWGITQFYLPPTRLSTNGFRKQSPDGTARRPQRGSAHILLQLTTHLSTSKGWKAEWPSWLTLYRTVYPHKWSSISSRSSVGQGKFAGHRPTFYHCAMQPTKYNEYSLSVLSKLFSRRSWDIAVTISDRTNERSGRIARNKTPLLTTWHCRVAKA